MSEKNSFNYLFLKRFIKLLHIFIPFSRLSLNVYNHNERIYSHPLVLILLILINQVALEIVIKYVGYLPSEYYTQLGKSPDQRDFSAFRWLLARSFGLVALNALFIALSSLLSSLLYVKWRMRLVCYLHSFYFTQQRYYHLANTTQLNQYKRDDDDASTYQNYTIQT